MTDPDKSVIAYAVDAVLPQTLWGMLTRSFWLLVGGAPRCATCGERVRLRQVVVHAAERHERVR